MAFGVADALAPSVTLLALAVIADFAIGDPVYAAHPVRLIGQSLHAIEAVLFRIGANGYVGGIALSGALATIWVGGLSLAVVTAARASPWLGWLLHLFLLYSLIALGDLLHHGWQIERAIRRHDLADARARVAQLVGRDTDRLDEAACRRAAIESLSENVTDGFVSPICWYVVAGLPGLVLFKIVSTMDSMVGYKTPRYLRFGWCGARLDDVMNYVPARLTFLLAAATAALVPACSSVKAIRVGWSQHALLPSPNSGWSEAAVAGAIQRKLVGPIWRDGALVTDLWLGDPSDPPLATDRDYTHASRFVGACGALAAGLACAIGWAVW